MKSMPLIIIIHYSVVFFLIFSIQGGEIHNSTEIFKERGYTVKSINLIDMVCTDRWNSLSEERRTSIAIRGHESVAGH